METTDIEKSMMLMIMVIMMAGVMMALIPQPAEAAPGPEPAQPTGFGCPYCGRIFDAMSELIAHISEIHPELPPFIEVDISWG